MQRVVLQRGYNAHRLEHPESNLEKLYAEAWDELCQPKLHTLSMPDSLFCGPKKDMFNPIVPPPNRTELTDRDRMVAATVIQWLGSNVGNSFVREVLAKNDCIAA